MNTTHETSDGDNLIIVCNETGAISFMRGKGKAKDFKSGAFKRNMSAAFGKVTA